MITNDNLLDIVFSLPLVEEMPHFDKSSYRIKKKIFLTHNKKENRICVKLNEADQYAFCAFDKSIIYPVPNKWGKQGWTLINLAKVELETLKDAIVTSYCHVAPNKIAKEYIDLKCK